ncbi:hypothetical protein DCAR_0415057 [Daucus carota subsp. sativus]|uniref:Uncharacterized protein n=1 Tax=Daucus carota subsp. sativus TaxID=79200 RepID=A0A165A614_DAUCS|nr:PREDICTED: uncharacterized protein LOC108216726 [Daucus carota subsp. sativus]WOG95730.1 hypothetical protein DCAR_0415057 [Daucus carota subsp. sativus]
MGFLQNKYWVLRHGKSIPNDQGIIVSSMENGVLDKYKLAPEGIDQARLAGQTFLKELEKNHLSIKDVRICYSPFSRTRHTAEMVASVLDLPFEGPQCKVVKDLHERYFGPSFELMSHDKYADIWALDKKDPFQPPEGGESVADVVSRLTNALLTIEAEFKGCAVLVVSHGDPLQILQTILNAAKDTKGSDSNDLTSRIQAVKLPSIISQHRKFALLTGEIRAVI